MININYWTIANIYVKSAEMVDEVKETVLPILHNLILKKKLKNYYYTHYKNPAENSNNHLKIGLWRNNFDESEIKQTLTKIEEDNKDKIIKIDYGKPGNKPEDNYDGITDVVLACYSREINDLLVRNIGRKLTLNQMKFILHFLFNQMGYNYLDEINTYLPLIENYSKNLPENIKKQLREIFDKLAKST
ncbi:hypothetical protein KAJ87_04085 [Candidatus Pacearchaeota archaeon]|nr:hypothetical protein [Candidatus Pacearchaeota archaeon]